jgi:hypothetical protein
MPTILSQSQERPGTIDWNELDRAQQEHLATHRHAEGPTQKKPVQEELAQPATLSQAQPTVQLRELSDPIKKYLQRWVESGRTCAEFFEVNSNILGDMAGYNLAEFTTPAASAATLSANLAAIAQLREPHIQTMQKQLSDKIKPILDLWLMRGRTVEEFFELNAAQLGHPNLYDLTGFHAPRLAPAAREGQETFSHPVGRFLAGLARNGQDHCGLLPPSRRCVGQP